MKVIRLDDFEQVSEYGLPWNDFLENSVDNHIFLTLEWLATWWKHYGKNRDLVLLAVEDNKKLLALAPLMNSAYSLMGVKLRRMEFIGTPTSDYHNFILTQKKTRCVKLILDYINNESWDCLDLKDIPENTETAKLLRTLPENPLKLRETLLDLCPFVPLPSTFEEYLPQLSKRLKRALFPRERKLRAAFQVEHKKYCEIGSVKETMKIFVKLHQKRWESKEQPGLFANQTFRDFHFDVAERFAEKGWLALCFVVVNGEPIAAEYCYRYGDKQYAYLSGFDPDYLRYGVGNLCQLLAIKTSIESGLKEFDLMRGAHAYKLWWNAQIRKNIELSAVRWKPVPKVYDLLVRSQKLAAVSDKLRRYVKLP